MTTYGEVGLAGVVTTMTIHAFVEWLFWLANILHATSTLKNVYNILGFASYITKYCVHRPSGVASNYLSTKYSVLVGKSEIVCYHTTCTIL